MNNNKNSIDAYKTSLNKHLQKIRARAVLIDNISDQIIHLNIHTCVPRLNQRPPLQANRNNNNERTNEQKKNREIFNSRPGLRKILRSGYIACLFSRRIAAIYFFYIRFDHISTVDRSLSLSLSLSIARTRCSTTYTNQRH